MLACALVSSSDFQTPSGLKSYIEHRWTNKLYVFKHCPAVGMRNGDEASPSIILASLALLEKMLITLEPCGSFGSNFLY